MSIQRSIGTMATVTVLVSIIAAGAIISPSALAYPQSGPPAAVETVKEAAKGAAKDAVEAIVPQQQQPAPALFSKAGPRLDPVAETQKYMDRLKGETREKSDAYFEGKSWLILWQFLYALVVAWLLLARRVSLRMREIAERVSHRPNVQALLYGLMYMPLVTLATLPLAIYTDYFREHQYALSNLTFAGWLVEAGMNLIIETILMSLVVVGLYAILRRAPRTWWAWGAAAGGAFMVVMVIVSPVFIAPLFNTYKPLPDGKLRDDILSMARANGIPANDVYWFDASKQSKRISANVSGMFGTTRIALNDNLLNRASPEAVKAVMAHEMGHYVLNHGPKHAVAFTLILLGGLLFTKAAWNWSFARFGARAGIRGIADPVGFPLFGTILSTYMLVATPLVHTVIRVAEAEADLYGLNASREPDGFAEAMVGLAEYRKMHPGPIEEALFFDHPSGYNRIYAAMRWKAENTK